MLKPKLARAAGLLALGAAASVGVQATLSPTQSQAQTKAPAKAPAKAVAVATAKAPEKSGAIRIYNPGGTADVDLENGVRHMTRNVKVWQVGEDFILRAEDVTHYEKDNTATARGNLRVTSRDSTITGDLLSADFDGKVLTIRGNVKMTSHGKTDGIQPEGGKTVRGEVLHKRSTLICDLLYYDYETKQATLTGNIQMWQEQNYGTCGRILFDEEENIARLEQNVRFENGNKQTILTPELTIWIDSNVIKAPRATSITIPRKPGDSKAPKAAPRQKQPMGKPPVFSPELLEGRDRKPIAVPAAPSAPINEAPRAEDEPNLPVDNAASEEPASEPTVRATPIVRAAPPAEAKKSG